LGRELITEGKEVNRLQDTKIVLKVKITLDEKWASNFPQEELAEYLKGQFNNTLGFRGRVERASMVKR